ncbi:hypothetical protein HK101_011063 [Irineochytrium annulatum]|nr:hypothetical protein HK101_011063 [Irineochytrium annulatum]
MTFSFDQIPSLVGKTYIVTGGNIGLGKVTCTELARKGATVVVASRSEEKTLPVIEEIKKETNNQNVTFSQIDLMSLKSVAAFVDRYLASGAPLDGLICNAGIMACPFALSADGIESQFATNHVAHHLLTTGLLPVLEKAPEARIVILASSLHKDAPKPEGVRFDKINDQKAYKPWVAYGQSKLSNILFAKELNARLQARGLTHMYTNAVHPGVILTGLVRHQGTLLSYALPTLYAIGRTLVPSEFMNADDGTKTQLYVATSPEIVEKNYKGEFFVPIAKHSKPFIPQGTDMDLAKRLWEFTEELIKEKLAA